MPDLVLTIGDKNVSSWSLRPWILLKTAEIAFEEETILLDRPDTRAALREKSPTGLVPFLTHGDLQVPETLAICEYLSDLYPEKNLWPTDIKARAAARAISSEMHAGFSNLRTVWPMQVLRRDLGHLTTGGVQRDIDRILAIWTDCRSQFGQDGPFLFGAFSIADAMYAPVVSRLLTYGPVPMNESCAAYVETIDALPAMAEWKQGAQAQEAAKNIS